MTRVGREFENLLLAVRSSVSMQRPASCALLDNLVEKTKKCFADQKRIQYWGIAYQVLVPTLGLASATSFGRSAFSATLPANWAQTINDALAKTDASTRLQWSSKIGDAMQTWTNAKGFDCQALQKQIDATTTEMTAVNQGQATFLQSLETALQRQQQIQDNAKR